MTPVSIRAVSKSYDGKTLVLDGLSLEIAAGELFFLLGGSGCGKTTLLRLIAGFHAPDSGTIHLAGEDVTAQPAERRGLGMVFQNYALWPHLSVAENVAFGLEVRGVRGAEKRQQVDQALALVELTGYGDRRIGELSGGQQQRVALARAIVVKPRVLLLDEPLSNLDARLRTTMRAEIRRVCKAAGLTAVYVTHDQKEALSTADRIAVMMAGTLAQVGTPRELYERPVSRAVATFIGEANLIPATVRDGRTVDCVLGALRAVVPPGLAVGSKIDLCVRPERIRFDAGADGNHFDATLSALGYFGESAQWALAVGGLKLVATEAAAPPRADGATVRCRIDPADLVVLAS